MRTILNTLGSAIALLASTCASISQERLKVAVGQIDNKQGLALETFGTSGSGETMQAVISGSTDIGVGVGVAAALRAFMSGAPVRVLLPGFTGTGDLYWYARTDSPIHGLQDAKDEHTIAYSTGGSTSYSLVLAFRDELGVKARPVATGSPAATLIAVMTGQVTIGWSAPPFGLKDIASGKIRIVGRGADVASMNRQTVRAIIVNARALAEKPEEMARFARGYRDAVDWMYSDPDALARYAQKIGAPVDLLKSSVVQFHPRGALQTDALEDMPGIVRDALKLKIILSAPTHEQQVQFIQIPDR